jgi:hypothetical protein
MLIWGSFWHWLDGIGISIPGKDLDMKHSVHQSPISVLFLINFIVLVTKKLGISWKFCIYNLSLTKLVIFWKIPPNFCSSKSEMKNHICKLLK